MRYRWPGLAGIGVAALAVGACDTDDLVRVNEDPNNPTTAPAPPVFTYATRISMQRWFGSNPTNMRGPVLTVQQLAQNQYPDEDQYLRLDGTVVDNSFINAYSQDLKNFQAVVDVGKADDEPLIWGPAQVMRSLLYGKVTDVWGDVPYSEALQGDAPEPIILPAFDPQKDIYAGLFNDLEEAATAMASGGTEDLGDADPIYGGDPVKWRRFANSLRARYAMRLANVDATTARAELNAAVSDPGGLMESNADNAQITWPGDGVYDNPWSVNNQTRDDHRLSKTLVDQMVPFNDPRIDVFAQPTQCFLNPVADGCPANPAKYAGLVNGLEATDAAEFAKVTSRPGEVFYSTDDFCVGCTRLDGASFPNVIMTYAEVSFILAEGAERGWIPGTPAALYEQGIRASMAQWGVTDQAAIAAYLARAEIAYQGGVAGLRQIALQKWIALYTNGVEAWSEWRRTCVPATIKPGPGAIINTVPRRYPYPVREHSVNSANVQAAIARQGEDDFETRVYWDTAPQAAPTWPGASCGVR
jgi:Starch-binding associating with outer membrane